MRAIRIAVPSSCWQSRQLGRTSYFESDSRQDFLKYKAPKWVQIKDVDCETEAAKRSQVMVRTMFPSARWGVSLRTVVRNLSSQHAVRHGQHPNEPTAIIAGFVRGMASQPSLPSFLVGNAAKYGSESRPKSHN